MIAKIPFFALVLKSNDRSNASGISTCLADKYELNENMEI